MAEGLPIDYAPPQEMAPAPQTTKTYFTHNPWLLALALVVVTFMAYQPVWHAGFIWDDDDYVTNNTALRTLDGLKRIWLEIGATSQYYPLTHTTFWAEYHLWGLNPLGYHVVNVSLHALNAILVWLVLRKLQVKGAWLAAAIFALHPVHVESVAWITERKNLISGFFYLSALLAYLRFLTAGRVGSDLGAPAGAKPWRFYWLALALYLCALCGKTVTCTLPLVILLLVWWKRGSLGWRDAYLVLPFLALGIAMGLTTVRVEGQHWSFSFNERCLIAGRNLWFYAGKLVWPRNLTFVYPRWQIDAGSWRQYIYPFGAAVVIAGLWRLRGRWGQGPLVAALLFVVTLAPALGFFDVFYFHFSFVADHFQYLASVALIALVASGGWRVCERSGRLGKPTGAVAVLATLMALGTLTWRQAHIHRDVETLWQDTVAKNPQCWLAQNNLGNALIRLGKVADAVQHYRQALRIKPDYAEAHNNLGNALTLQGKVLEAIAECTAALRLRPNLAEAHGNLGVALLRLGKPQEAVGHFELWLRTHPDDAKMHNKLGNALLQAGKLKAAVEHYEQALRIAPDLVEAQNNLAWLLATLAPPEGGDPVRAVALAQRVCEQTGNRMATYLDTLAVAYAAAGRFNDAIATSQKAIELARTSGPPELVKEIEGRLQLYRDGRPYRESIHATNPQRP